MNIGISNGLKRYCKFLGIIIFLFLFLYFLFNYKLALAPERFGGYKTEEIKIEGKIINVEIADTLEKKIKGLSGRQTLPENQGMLFIFDRPDYYDFWMKDMNFSLDFIWIKGDEVVELTRNIKPEDYQPPRLLVPKNKVDKVLEVNAGAVDRLKINGGDKIEF